MKHAKKEGESRIKVQCCWNLMVVSLGSTAAVARPRRWHEVLWRCGIAKNCRWNTVMPDSCVSWLREAEMEWLITAASVWGAPMVLGSDANDGGQLLAVAIWALQLHLVKVDGSGLEYEMGMVVGRWLFCELMVRQLQVWGDLVVTAVYDDETLFSSLPAKYWCNLR